MRTREQKRGRLKETEYKKKKGEGGGGGKEVIAISKERGE